MSLEILSIGDVDGNTDETKLVVLKRPVDGLAIVTVNITIMKIFVVLIIWIISKMVVVGGLEAVWKDIEFHNLHFHFHLLWWVAGKLCGRRLTSPH